MPVLGDLHVHAANDSIALFLMILTMLCWGSWANTQKLTNRWPFELYYFGYTIGLLVCSVLLGLTLGQIDPTSPTGFFLNLQAASGRSLWCQLPAELYLA